MNVFLLSLINVATLLQISPQNFHRPRKVQTMIRPTYSQMKTSSQSLNASVSRKYCSLRKNPAESTTHLSLYANVMLSSGTFVFPEERVIAIREKHFCTLFSACDWLPSESTQHVCEVKVWINCVTHEIVFNGHSSSMKDTDHDASGKTF